MQDLSENSLINYNDILLSVCMLVVIERGREGMVGEDGHRTDLSFLCSAELMTFDVFVLLLSKLFYPFKATYSNTF